MAKLRKIFATFTVTIFFSFFLSSIGFAFPNVKTLDNYWTNRHIDSYQTKITQFLNAYEPIPQNFDIAWRVARLVYFIGNFAPGYEKLSKTKKIEFYQYGYEAGDIARKIKPNRVEGHYWYATNLGLYGINKGIFSALSSAEEGRDSLLKAVEIDPSYHWGGPYRILGRFYQEVPGFISFGDKGKAIEYFKKAIQVAPNFRLNTIDLGILHNEIGNYSLALELLEQAEKKPKVDGPLEEKRYLTELKKGIQTLKSEENE